MRRILFYFSIGIFLASCAGKKTVSDSWDTSPAACDRLTSSACTPLPQELPEKRRVEAGLRAASDGGELQYYRSIDEHPKLSVLFIHGILGHAADFRKEFSRPLEGMNLLAYDRPGYGRSRNPKDSATLASNAKAAQVFLDIDPQLPLILVGHSYGGAIAMKVALDHPERVKGLVLISAILDPEKAAPLQLQKLAESLGLFPREMRQSNREILNLKKELQEIAPRLAALRIPIEAIHGAQDDLVGVENVDYLSRELRKAGHSGLLHSEICAECGHHIPDFNPEYVNGALERIGHRVLGK